jgi:hypothetical protein
MSALDDSLVVYTAISGGYDRLREPPGAATADAEFVAFLEAPSRSRTWRWRPIHSGFQDPVRNAKIHKILPHVFFPDAAYSLWMDGSVSPRFAHSARRLIDLYLADHDIAVFRHGRRTCVYQEASHCLQPPLDEPDRIWEQVCRYTREGYPANAGLAECPVVLRRHTAAVRAFSEAWWNEIVRGSRRDQLSFPYVARKLAMAYATFPGTIEDNPLFRRGRHAAPLTQLGSRLLARAARVESWASSQVRAVGVRARAALSRDGRDAPPWPHVLTGPAPLGAVSEPERPLVTERLKKTLRPAWRSLTATGSPPRWAGTVTHTAGPRRPRRRTIGVGPVREFPSWEWVGFDTARELSRHYDVILYESWASPPACDVLFVVKQRPPAALLAAMERSRTRLVYCPIDVYEAPDDPDRDAELLGSCDMVLVHSERLLPLLRPRCRQVHFVEHHLRYALSSMAEYRDRGYVLWIGGCQYLPYLLSWLERHPLERELRILTDIGNPRARDRARVLAADIGMPFSIRADATVAGHRVEPWSQRRQEEMMRECKAALDAKFTARFNQYYKPPTKAQQFVGSGVPFAVNPDSYSAEYFRTRGFTVASPAETDRWLSRAYWEETRDRGHGLRTELSLEAVGATYQRLIEALWEDAR